MNESRMNYFRHLGLNIKVALKGFVLVLFHLAHGILPIKLTDHEYWKIRFAKADINQAQDDMLEIVGGALGKKGREFLTWKKRRIKKMKKSEVR